MPKLVTCNGCFDGLHEGHLFFLGVCYGVCRAEGGRLGVGINCDNYLKEKRANHASEKQRREALMALGFVSWVTVFYEDDPCDWIQGGAIPDIHCIGMEYRGRAPEERVCDEMGIRVVYIPRVGEWSSTKLREEECASGSA